MKEPRRSGALPEDLSMIVVEDDDDVRELAVSALESVGFRVYSARHGRMALEVLERQSDIQLLFTDIRMPVMDGEELVSEAIKRRPDIKVVLTTGFSSRTRYRGVFPVIRKPYRLGDLLDAFTTVFTGGAPHPAGDPAAA
jgi:CheY-like chemotaxis protein